MKMVMKSSEKLSDLHRYAPCQGRFNPLRFGEEARHYCLVFPHHTAVIDREALVLVTLSLQLLLYIGIIRRVQQPLHTNSQGLSHKLQ